MRADVGHTTLFLDNLLNFILIFLIVDIHNTKYRNDKKYSEVIGNLGIIFKKNPAFLL